MQECMQAPIHMQECMQECSSTVVAEIVVQQHSLVQLPCSYQACRFTPGSVGWC
jgi:hypothetical protein